MTYIAWAVDQGEEIHDACPRRRDGGVTTRAADA